MNVFIVGPGGVGKSTSGKILAQLLDYNCIDLDLEFCNQIGNIGEYIRSQGYESYCHANSELFYTLLKKHTQRMVWMLSSGFLVHEECSDLVHKHTQTIKKELSILLLPSRSIDESEDIVVERQLKRGFGLKEERERKKFRERYVPYQSFGDVQIYSVEEPQVVAQEMLEEVARYVAEQGRSV
ncbi:MAG: shikimate kinase [Parcubacteria group bacterium]|nr:shikimate kinase [Parcubacteria group bacterium]|tara:strand:+ start:71 stop:619 length:549 start_codon:yes stop_codon:yes gene_type:complete